jgi:undecaprenyl-diphosphatase
MLPGGGRSWLPVVAGLGCLGAVLILGVVVKHGATPLDQAARRALRGWASQQHLTRHVVGAIAQERGRYHGSYVSAVLPLLCAAILAAGRLRRGRGRWWSTLRARAWPWLLWLSVLLCSLPLVEALRVAFDRPDPTESANPKSPLGSYPSGAALLVAVGWIVGGTVIMRLRPSWRRPLLVVGAVVLAVHAAARAAVGAHWLTDVLGAWALATVWLAVVVAAMLLTSRPRERGSTEPTRQADRPANAA